MAASTVNAGVFFATVEARRANDVHMGVCNMTEERVDQDVVLTTRPPTVDPVLRDPIHAVSLLHVFSDGFTICPDFFTTAIPLAESAGFGNAGAEIERFLSAVGIGINYFDPRLAGAIDQFPL